MPQNFTLYTIYALGRPGDDEPFDLSRLPLEISDGVFIEELKPLLKENAFDYVTPQMGTWAVEHLKQSRYAFVYRYDAGSKIVDGTLIQEHEQAEESAEGQGAQVGKSVLYPVQSYFAMRMTAQGLI